MNRALFVLAALTLSACTTATQRPSPAAERAAMETPPVAASPDAPSPTANLKTPEAPTAGKPAAAGEVIDRPALRSDVRVSASPGDSGGVTILWPRIIPADPAGARTQNALAIQKRLEAVADVEMMGFAQDVRPAPERVCPQAGCKGVSLGVLLVHKGTGCAAVALLSAPGRSETLLVPWAGELTLKRARIPFREPPESEVVVRDFALCSELAAKMAEREPTIREAVRSLRASQK